MTNNQSMLFVADIEGPPPETISNEFAKYTRIVPLTSGGKANLFVGKDTNLGRSVVLKMLDEQDSRGRIELRRLLREARITAQLQHPATVPLYELGQTDTGQWFFAMKKIEGQTLFQIIVGLARREEVIERKFQLNRLLSILTSVGDALAYAHARGVIHRDIKPENILVGMFGEVTLIDWGIAKIWGMGSDGDETNDTQRVGTPLYMSPEQVAGNGLIDERTDIFSLGIVMYEMMAQREPFRGRNKQETFDNILHKEPTAPKVAAPHRNIPMKLQEICLKAMQKKPSDRYQSVAQMMEDIESFRSNALMREA